MSVDIGNQSLNPSGELPPLPVAPVASATPTTGNIGEDNSWPGKKKNNNLKYILGGFLALTLVLGTAFGAYYFTRNLNQASVPTAPESEPQAAARKNEKGEWEYTNKDGSRRVFEEDDIVAKQQRQEERQQQASCSTSAPTNMKVTKLSPTSAKLSWTPGIGGYVKLWVSSAAGSPTLDCARLANKVTDAVCVANENGKLINGDANHADIPATTTEWTLTNLKPSTTYYWRLMMWTSSTCDTGPNPISFTTDAAVVACVSGVDTADKQDTCTGTGITVGTKVLGYTCKNQVTKELNLLSRSTCTELSSLKAQAELLCKQKYPCPGETACVDSTWSPNVNTVCKDTKFLQKSNCNIEREAVGTKTDGTCSTCTNETWSPNVNTVCKDVEFTQKSSCDATKTRKAIGTKTDGNCATSTEVDLSIEKRAYEDEDGNSAGDYELVTEIDSVSKNQIFVYAFEVTNDGDSKVEDIKVVDTLKGDNTDLLTYVDGDDRCTYASSTRKVTCDGMDLPAGDSDTYAFRVKVSNNAINGDTIMNAGEISYKNMPDGGEIDASSELTISTVVGCNHVCTSDDECSTGLTCDTDTNKCRKPSCAEASSCNCPVERVATAEPTQRATVARAQPTELVEAGILDFPGVATFGGGLLLAIIGILLAL